MVLEGFADAATALEALGNDQELATRRKILLEQPVVVVTRDSGLASVHVLAEEMAFVAPAVHDVDLVASDDATTCSIVLLVCGGIVGVAHLDSATQMPFFLSHWEALVGAAPSQVAIAGGFDDERGIARPITLSILEALMESKSMYEIRQFITGKWNTRETEDGVVPLTRGIGYTPAEDTFRVVEFEADARLPMVPTRFAGVSPDPLHLLMCCVEKTTPLTINVGPYWTTLVSSGACAYLLELEDDELLPQISTSPSCEGPKFLQDVRDMLQFISTCSPRSLGDTNVLAVSLKRQDKV